MKQIICALLILTVLFVSSVSVSAEPMLENLEAPLENYLKDHTDELRGRSIWDMTVYKNKLYIGWGDYGDNLGAKLGGIPLLSYFDATNVWKFEETLDDEQISRFFLYDNKLYITGTDPIKGIGNLYVGNEEGDLRTVSTFDGGIHVFDMLISEDVMYVSYGQNAESKAVIRYSTDHTTFNDIEFRYDGKPIVPSGNAFARSYNLFEFGGEIYATLRILNSTDEYDGIYKLDKTDMVLNYVGKGPSGIISNGISPSFDLEFRGNFVYAYGGIGYTKNPDDEKSWKTMPDIYGRVTCAKVADEFLYFTAYTENEGKYKSVLYRTKDLQTAEIVYSLDSEAFIQSFCHDNGVFYFGMGYAGDESNPAAGAVFSLKTQKDAKTDIVVKASVEDLDTETEPVWMRCRIKVGDTVVKEEVLNKLNGWEILLSNVDVRDDWSVEITKDSGNYEWSVEKSDEGFVLKNAVSNPVNPLIIVSVIAVGVLLMVGVFVLVLKLRR